MLESAGWIGGGRVKSISKVMMDVLLGPLQIFTGYGYSNLNYSLDEPFERSQGHSLVDRASGKKFT